MSRRRVRSSGTTELKKTCGLRQGYMLLLVVDSVRLRRSLVAIANSVAAGAEAARACDRSSVTRSTSQHKHIGCCNRSYCLSPARTRSSLLLCFLNQRIVAQHCLTGLVDAFLDGFERGASKTYIRHAAVAFALFSACLW